MRRKEYKVGKIYTFNSASQTVWDVWGRLIKVEGKHTFTKVKDTFMDVLHGRSWYLMDGRLLVAVTRNGYIEQRCLMESGEDETEEDGEEE